MSPEFEALQRKLDAEIDIKRDAAGEGQCKSWEDYKYLTGEIQGLLLARFFLRDLAKKVNDDDDN